MHVCVVDAEGRTQEHVNLPCDPGRFLKLIAPYRERLVVCCECLFAWYWLADLCREEGISFVLWHALYMKAIHGGKVKSDKIDSEKIARMLRGGMLPQAYVYPKEMRGTRDLLRRRMKLVRAGARTRDEHVHAVQRRAAGEAVAECVQSRRHRRTLHRRERATRGPFRLGVRGASG